MAQKRIAVVLAGCGYLDGAEIQEAVSTFIAIDRAGAAYQVFAPDKVQHHVVNHITKSPAPGETRNVLAEAARIARSAAHPLHRLLMKDWDAVILPGGFGVVKNLVDYAFVGVSCSIDSEVERVLKEARALHKPVGAICIAPMVVARALGREYHPTLTIGEDAQAAHDIEKLGARHRPAPPSGIVIDEANRIVSTPAYMSATRVSEVFEGVSRLVEQVLAWA